MRWMMVVGSLAFVWSCQGQAGEKDEKPKDEAGAVAKAENPAESAEKKLYTVASVPEALDPASENAILVQLKPVPGYHWNLEYPTSFKVTTKAGLSTDKPAYSVAEESITATDGGADIPMKVRVEKGFEGLELTGNFSLCQDDSCKLFRNEKVVVPLSTK